MITDHCTMFGSSVFQKTWNRHFSKSGTLTVAIAIQSFRMIPQLIVLCHHTKSGYKRLSGSDRYLPNKIRACGQTKKVIPNCNFVMGVGGEEFKLSITRNGLEDGRKVPPPPRPGRPTSDCLVIYWAVTPRYTFPRFHVPAARALAVTSTIDQVRSRDGQERQCRITTSQGSSAIFHHAASEGRDNNRPRKMFC